MSAIIARQFQDVFVDSRALLNDQNDDIYHNEILLPYAALKHMDIQQEFAKHDIPVTEKVTSIGAPFDYDANAFEIEIPNTIEDLYEPIELWEKATSGGSWRPMKLGRIPAPPQSTQYPRMLTEWEWRNGQIFVTPCSLDRLVLVRYRTQSDYPTVATPIAIEGFYAALAAGVAMEAAAATGRDGLAVLNERRYAQRLATAIDLASRNLQSVGVRWGGANS